MHRRMGKQEGRGDEGEEAELWENEAAAKAGGSEVS